MILVRRVSFTKAGVFAGFVSPTVTLSGVIGGSTSSTNKDRLGNEERFKAWREFRATSLGCIAAVAPQICYLSEADPTGVHT